MLLILIVLFASCSNETPLIVDAPYSEITSVDWNVYPNGTYKTSQATNDLGNISNWDTSRANIVNGSLQIKLITKALSNAGIIAKWDIEHAKGYEISYDILFEDNFDWSKGGKCGFGLQIGDGNTGGDPAWDGNGGSMRMMWYTNSSGRTYLQPYVYYKDQPTTFGDNFGVSFPISGNIQKNEWYSIKIKVISNTEDTKNGLVFISVNDTVLLNEEIRWTTNSLKSDINKVTFTTFRGGSTDEWKSDTESYIRYDNLKYSKI